MTRHLLCILRFAVILLLLFLSGCADGALALTYGERMATAEAQGCWAGAERTPRPVTVTPLPVTPLPPTLVNPGDPTATPAPSATALPTTTPLPRCTPQPGTTQAPWPTPWPTRPPLPTRVAADRQYPVISNHAVFRLPDAILALDLAVHPTEGWPVVAALDVPLGHAGPARVFVAAYDDAGAAWHPGVLVSLPGSAPGHHFFHV
jgi:hypothetical protein